MPGHSDQERQYTPHRHPPAGQPQRPAESRPGQAVPSSKGEQITVRWVSYAVIRDVCVNAIAPAKGHSESEDMEAKLELIQWVYKGPEGSQGAGAAE